MEEVGKEELGGQEEEPIAEEEGEPIEDESKENIAQAEAAKTKSGCCKCFCSGKRMHSKEDHEILAKKMLRELIIYLIFLLLVCFIAFGTTSSYSYYYTKVMKDLFVGKKGSAFHKVNSVYSFWEYVDGPLKDGLYWEKWYNSRSLATLEGYIYYENKLLGKPRMRQVRVKRDSCIIINELQEMINDCYGPYKTENEDVEPFGKALANPKNLAWIYRSSEQIDGFWHWGDITSYDGGGYVQDLSLSRDRAEVSIEDLFLGLWIDRATRAVFISFTVYNANINLFCVITLIVEFPPTGGAFPSWSFTTIKLIHYDNKDNFQKTLFVCQVFFCLFIFYYFIIEAIEMFLVGTSYFSDFWNTLDMCLVLCSTVCIGFQLYRELFVVTFLPEILSDFKKYQDFASLAFWESRSNNIIAITVFLAWVKVFKYITFNKTMTQLATTLSRCAKDLMGFFIMFFIVFLSFTQLGYMLFGGQVADYSTFMNSFFTLFRIILGDFDFYQLEKANRILGPIFFMLFVFFVFFVLINMFLAIINDTYSEVKSDVTKETDMSIMADYLHFRYTGFVQRIWAKGEPEITGSISEQFATKGNVLVEEWIQILVDQGFEAELVEGIIEKLEFEKGQLLDATEQKKILNEISKQKNVEINVEQEDEENPDEKSSDVVPAEQFIVLLRRVERMETTMISIVGNIDNLLLKISQKTQQSE